MNAEDLLNLYKSNLKKLNSEDGIKSIMELDHIFMKKTYSFNKNM